MGSFAETQPKTSEDEEEEETFTYAMQLSMSVVLPMAMHTAIELDVFEILNKAGADAKLSASEIAAQITTTNPDASIMLERILRLLVSHCVLGCSVSGGQRLYSLTPVSKYFVSNQDGVSLRPYMDLIQDNVTMQNWFQLKNAIVEGGIPFTKVHGMHVFEYLGTEPRFNELFNNAMFNYTTIVMKRILESYKGFEQLKQVVDVGGGLGITLNIITSKYPHIKGVNFDLPHVIQHAPSFPGVEHIGGDFFAGIPNGDSILLKWILHNWDDEHCLKLLKHCYKAIPEDGKIIAIDAVVPIVPKISGSARETSLMDVIMLIQLPGGKERTQEEYLALATEAGFKGINFQCVVCNYCVMEFFK